MGKTKIQEKIDELKKAHEKSSPEDLLKALAKAELDKEAADKSKTDAEADVEELNQKLSDYESGKIKKLPKPEVKVGNTTFIIKSPKVKILGKSFTAAQIKENKETVTLKGKTIKIANFLVDRKSGVLVPKSEKK